MSLRLLRFVVLWLAAIPVLCAQAALEYALKSGQSSMAADPGSLVGGCRVDSAVFSCLGHAYPRTTVAVSVVAGLLVLRWVARVAGYRR